VIQKNRLWIALIVVSVLSLLAAAFLRPYYFSDSHLLGVVFFLQLTIAILWKYQARYFLFLIVTFLWAGTPLPMHEVWTAGRWFVLGVGATTGVLLFAYTHRRPFRAIHLIAAACVLAAVVSALASVHPEVALLKSVSLFLLFLFGAAGARIAIVDRPQAFFSGLLFACELLVYLTAICYFALHLEAYGNRNSLGVVMGVVTFPILLWGLMISDRPSVRRRRIFALLVCLLLLFSSYERAGIVAALVSSVTLCIGVRRYTLLVKGLVVAVAIAFLASVIEPPLNSPPSDDGSLASRFVYKGKRDEGVLNSRRSVWGQTVSSLRVHPWFGTGFGTSATFDEEGRVSNKFSSAAQVSREHGNSYLEIAEWVGILGVSPFVLLLALIVTQLLRVVRWMRQTGSASCYAVPLTLFLAGALVHAGFEDWLFAVGYHTCVLFWSFAFVLPDLLPDPGSRQIVPMQWCVTVEQKILRPLTVQ